MSKRPPFEPMQYAHHLKSTEDFAVLNHTLHRWTGQFWKALSFEEAQREALLWLDSHSGGAVIGARQARDAVNTALLWLPQLSDTRDSTLLIPLKNGYLVHDDRKFVLLPHDRALGVHYMINCDYLPSAPPPALFSAFIERILPDTGVRERVQEYLGYTLMADARFQRGQVWIGTGANGKGVLANIVQAFHQHVATLNLAELGGFALSHILGATLIYIDEVPHCKIDDAIPKRLVAGETAPIRRHYQPTINVRILAKWLVLSNNIPRVEDQSDGFWRRFDMVPFEVTIPETERDPLLAEKIIRDEMSGVLNWLLEGLLRLLNRGRFDPIKPGAISKLDNDSRIRTDSVRAWVEDEDIALLTTCTTHKDNVYQDYASWVRRNGMSPQSAFRFWSSLRHMMPDLNTDGRMTDDYGRRIRTCNVRLPRYSLASA